MIEISYINYRIDRNGYITSGNRNNPVTEKFEVTFRKDFEKESLTKCPNCGASMDVNATGRCPYCNNIFKQDDYDYILTDIS